jgi:hypothetical protein
MLILDMDRAFGPEAGLALIERLGELRRAGAADRVIGAGMDSTELGVDPRVFAPAFELAGRLGLRRTAHAGEDTGPENIATALDALGIERVDHGLSALQDPELTKRLAGERIPLDVCPNSNVMIANKVPTLAEHPFRRMREKGLLATLITDDSACRSTIWPPSRSTGSRRRGWIPPIAGRSDPGSSGTWPSSARPDPRRSPRAAILTVGFSPCRPPTRCRNRDSVAGSTRSRSSPRSRPA